MWLSKLRGRCVATSKDEATRVADIHLLPAPGVARSSSLHKIPCCGEERESFETKSSPFQMTDLAKNPGGTMWAPTAGGVMRNPDL